VKSFKLPEKGSVGGLQARESRAGHHEESAPDSSKKSRSRKGTLRTTNQRDEGRKQERRSYSASWRQSGATIPFARTTRLSRDGKNLIVTTTGNEAPLRRGVRLLDATRKDRHDSQTGKDHTGRPACDEAGTQAAFVADRTPRSRNNAIFPSITEDRARLRCTAC